MPLKYLSNCFRSLDVPLKNCKVSLDLSFFRRNNPLVPAINNPTNAVFDITDFKLYVPVVTLSAENENKLLGQLKTGFKINIPWNKYRSEISNQTVNSNLNYLIDPTFTKVNRLFVLAFENEEDTSSFSNDYVPKVEIKVYNVLIDQKPFF